MQSHGIPNTRETRKELSRNSQTGCVVSEVQLGNAPPVIVKWMPHLSEIMNYSQTPKTDDEIEIMKKFAVNEIGVLRELQTSSHPGVAQMISSFTTKSASVIVMTRYTTDLFAVVEERLLTMHEVKHIFRQVAAALAHLHGYHRCAHMDVSLENVVLEGKAGGEYRAMLIDFGAAIRFRYNVLRAFTATAKDEVSVDAGDTVVAIAADPTSADPSMIPVMKVRGESGYVPSNVLQLSMCTARIGKEAYMAPEVFRRDYTPPKADVWSCGVLLYTMLLGFPVYTAPTYDDNTYQYLIHRGPIALLEAFYQKNQLTEDLWERAQQVPALLTGMLQATPEQRLTMPEVANHPELL